MMRENNNRGNFRGQRNSGGRFGGNRGNGRHREMHKATCAKCKKSCEVPFKPTEGRPVYCRECFSKERNF